MTESNREPTLNKKKDSSALVQKQAGAVPEVAESNVKLELPKVAESNNKLELSSDDLTIKISPENISNEDLRSIILSQLLSSSSNPKEMMTAIYTSSLMEQNYNVEKQRHQTNKWMGFGGLGLTALGGLSLPIVAGTLAGTLGEGAVALALATSWPLIGCGVALTTFAFVMNRGGQITLPEASQLSGANLSKARYSYETRFPSDFDPKSTMIRIDENYNNPR